jgi:hypothetical protein
MSPNNFKNCQDMSKVCLQFADAYLWYVFLHLIIPEPEALFPLFRRSKPRYTLWDGHMTMLAFFRQFENNINLSPWGRRRRSPDPDCCSQEQQGAARNGQELPGATRSSQEQTAAARSSQEQPVAVRSGQAQPGAARNSQQQPGAARSSQERKLMMKMNTARTGPHTHSEALQSGHLVWEGCTFMMKMKPNALRRVPKVAISCDSGARSLWEWTPHTHRTAKTPATAQWSHLGPLNTARTPIKQIHLGNSVFTRSDYRLMVSHLAMFPMASRMTCWSYCVIIEHQEMRI